MSTRTKATLFVVIVIIMGVVLAVACLGAPVLQRPAQYQQQEQSDGDCDEGDKYESVPDPDCNGIWYGTPRPAASLSKKATNPARTPARPAATGTRRR